MQSSHRILLGGAWTVSVLAGCSFGSVLDTSSGSATASSTSVTTVSGSSGKSAPTGYTTGSASPPTVDPVNATPSVAGTVSVIAGASQTMTVAFTSTSGSPISGLALSDTTLPADWSGPTNFTCTVTGAGNNCVLTLTYTPTAVEAGTVTIGYVYIGDPIAPATVTLSIPYAGTAADNIVATPSPIGQINAVTGRGSQSVSINFTTDDGHAATGLTVQSNLASLPAGWSTTAPGFSCAIISNGNGCQLVLNYAPIVAGSGTLSLNYGYTDDSGAARTGAVNVPYSTTADGSVVATVSPAGQVNAIESAGSQAVTLTFTTDDGQSASGLTFLSPQSSLPAGWSGSLSGFTCDAVSTGNGCQVKLNYAPTALTSGTVALEYSYTSPAGAFTTGFVNIAYAATTSDNVVATPAPSGQISAIVGEVNPSLSVTFTTDDMRTATDLQLTDAPATLPAGWASTDSPFSCAGVNGGTACRLPLTFTPTAAAGGTMTLGYTYLDNAGQAKNGTINVPYRATTDDTILGTASPASLAVLTGTTTPVTVTFATSDGNPESALSVTSGLAPLPTGWSGADGTFACSSFSAATTCQLALSYQPTLADNGTLVLGFSYTNDSGMVKTGTVSIPYAATVPVPSVP